MDPDDIEYKKSVRNMLFILTAIVITIFAAIIIPPYAFPKHNVYLQSVSEVSPFPFTLHLTLNTTSVSPSGGVLITGWINSSSAAVEDINASSSWALPQSRLWGRICTSGWPIGVGVMEGHYTDANFTLGTLVSIRQPLYSCPAQGSTPRDFLLRPHSSEALVTIGGSPEIWVLQSHHSFSGYLGGPQLSPGIYTAVLADEWGDVLTTNFLVT